MKAQQNMKGGPGTTTSARAFTDHIDDMKQKGISNGGGQRSDQTSNRDTVRKQTTKRRPLL